jgi:hypothetical protein
LVIIAVFLLCIPVAPEAKTIPPKLNPEGQLEDDPYITMPPAADLSCGTEWRVADIRKQGGEWGARSADPGIAGRIENSFRSRV